ncbi:alpha-D-ribose 1-methylphosphonate 5-triphosphate diphosphatase [Fluviibacterium sp. DFM31]|uniref:Alpha-D-ribose 1-methylphosphonate 5-triphosphate diphosphatase n=1 Tax=Meridianimarinicoccus marinus TaxID=3231483 RepID=A0ABV3L399_9RHOB
MTGIAMNFTGAEVLWNGKMQARDFGIGSGSIMDSAQDARGVDLRGWRVLPGIVDLHGDGFERHVAARRGGVPDMGDGIVAFEAELAANGITTAVMAQFYSWEGGLRSPQAAERLVATWQAEAPALATDLRLQLRLETHFLEAFADAEELIDRAGITYVGLNDHLPHDRLAAGRTPPRLTGTALKSGRSPQAHLALMQQLHGQADAVPAALDGLCKRLSGKGIMLASHDDATAQARHAYRARGVRIAEFPETLAAATEARVGGDGIVLGAPNVVRGASHAGKASARELIAQGLCDALASDYHYPALRKAVWALVDYGILPFDAAWALVSEGPARLLGLEDRGVIAPGKRADLVIVDPASGRVGATIAAGRLTYLTGPLAARFLA